MFAFWKSSSSASSSKVADVEAQRPHTADSLTFVLPALPTLAHTTSTAPPIANAKDDEEEPTNAIDDFFGVTYSKEERRAQRLAASTSSIVATPTHASRHDDQPLPSSSSQSTPEEETTDAIDDFFGVTRPRSQEQANRMSNPPPYIPSRDLADAECGSLPPYDEFSSKYETDSLAPELEPYTIPEFLFRWGFRTLFSSCLLVNPFLTFLYSLPPLLVMRRLLPL